MNGFKLPKAKASNNRERQYVAKKGSKNFRSDKNEDDVEFYKFANYDQDITKDNNPDQNDSKNIKK